MDYEKIMRRARRVNAKRDRDERKAGFAAPSDGPLSQQIRTAMSAIEAGIRVKDWNCIAEGQAMLELLAEKSHQLEIELVGKPPRGGIYTNREMKPDEMIEELVKVYLGDSYLGTIRPK